MMFPPSFVIMSLETMSTVGLGDPPQVWVWVSGVVRVSTSVGVGGISIPGGNWGQEDAKKEGHWVFLGGGKVLRTQGPSA